MIHNLPDIKNIVLENDFENLKIFSEFVTCKNREKLHIYCIIFLLNRKSTFALYDFPFPFRYNFIII